MDVEDRLAGLAVTVQQHAVAARIDAVFCGDLTGHQHHPAHEPRIIRLQIIGGGDVPLRDHQDMSGGLRIDVAERHDFVVFIDDIRLNLTGDHAAEQAIRHVAAYTK